MRDSIDRSPPVEGAADIALSSQMLICAAAIALMAALAILFEWKLDDAYITFVYARNWAQGHGLVFNLGEKVEGYTCFAWVVLSALAFVLGVDIVRWSTALGILSTAGTMLVAWRLARDLAPSGRRDAAVLAAVLVGLYPPVWWWTASGMETALFTFLVTLAIWRHVCRGADSLGAPIALALASMTRPEAWLLSVVLCADAVRTGNRRAALRYVTILLALFAPYYAWRCAYYGYPLPNTFYAKVGATWAQMVRGVLYLVGFLVFGGAVLLIGMLHACRTGVLRRVLPVLVFVSAYTTYVVVVGGDAFSSYRFFVPIIPTLAALTIAGVIRAQVAAPARRRVGPWGRGATYAVALAVCSLPLFISQVGGWVAARDFERGQRQTCWWIRDHTRPTDAVATVGIGLVKFCSERRVIDMAGITDTHIAHRQVPHMGGGQAGHEKFDSQYVLAQRPAYIFIPEKDYFPPLPAVIDMWNQPEFLKRYRREGRGYERIDTDAAGAP
jgi:arabinofuranosyltransferase